MSKLSTITDTALERVLELAGQAGGGLKHGGSTAADWLKTGAALGALKTGGKVASKAVRRHPGAAIAVAAVGAGLLGYAVYRKHKKSQQQAQRYDDRPHIQIDDAADLDV